MESDGAGGVRAVTPATIAVDLTPLLPGGANGGAKRFVLALLQEMKRESPGSRFILLTQAASHADLAFLDGPNVERRMVLGASTASGRGGLFATASRLLAFTPAPVRRAAARLGYRLNESLKRRGALPALRAARPDLLFCPFTAPALRLPGVPTVCTVHDLQYRAHPEFFSVEEATLRELAVRDACRHANAIAAISEHTRREVIGEGVDAARVTTIAHRLARSVGDAALPGRLALAPRGYFLYPANPWPHKNHEALLAAFAVATRGGLDPALLLVCTGELGARTGDLARLAGTFGIADRVRFAGYVDDDELDAITANALALIFPSLYEGFGLPVIEAMAAGVPVACSAVAALEETAGEAALLFDPRSTEEIARVLVRLGRDAELRRSMSQRGRERAAQFLDAGRMAREYLALFERAAAAPP